MNEELPPLLESMMAGKAHKRTTDIYEPPGRLNNKSCPQENLLSDLQIIRRLKRHATSTCMAR